MSGLPIFQPVTRPTRLEFYTVQQHQIQLGSTSAEGFEIKRGVVAQPDEISVYLFFCLLAI